MIYGSNYFYRIEMESTEVESQEDDLYKLTRIHLDTYNL